MRTLAPALAAAAALTAAAAGSTPTAAMPAAPDAVRAAADAAAITEPVHCRPGRWHHRYAPHDGCYRRAYRTYRYYYHEPDYAYPYYGYYHGPSIHFDFRFGHRRHHRRW